MRFGIVLSLLVIVWTGTAFGQSLRAGAPLVDIALAAADTTGGGEKNGLTGPEEMKRNLRMMSRMEVPGDKEWQRKKSPRVAMFSAMLLPGLGQLYNGRRIKTVLMVGVSGFYMSKIWLEHKSAQRRKQVRDSYPVDSAEWRYENLWYDFHKEHTRDYAWWSGAVWIIGVLDAYIDAHLYDVRTYRPRMEANGDGTDYLTVNFTF